MDVGEFGAHAPYRGTLAGGDSITSSDGDDRTATIPDGPVVND